MFRKTKLSAALLLALALPAAAPAKADGTKEVDMDKTIFRLVQNVGECSRELPRVPVYYYDRTEKSRPDTSTLLDYYMYSVLTIVPSRTALDADVRNGSITLEAANAVDGLMNEYTALLRERYNARDGAKPKKAEKKAAKILNKHRKAIRTYVMRIENECKNKSCMIDYPVVTDSSGTPFGCCDIEERGNDGEWYITRRGVGCMEALDATGISYTGRFVLAKDSGRKWMKWVYGAGGLIIGVILGGGIGGIGAEKIYIPLEIGGGT